MLQFLCDHSRVLRRCPVLLGDHALGVFDGELLSLWVRLKGFSANFFWLLDYRFYVELNLS
jgi:hypothetical protein